MYLKLILVWILFGFFPAFTSARVMVRLFSNQSPESALFSVIKGEYELNAFNGKPLFVTNGESVIVFRYGGKLAVKMRNTKGFVCDSFMLAGKTGDDSFSLLINRNTLGRQYYSGDLKCFPDLGTIVLINNCDVEDYISGVVKAEGGNGKNIEYFKTQSVIARTYMCRYFDKHLSDKYNICDNTHCQAFNGLSFDTLVNSAVMKTQGLVILAPDSTLIISAFHSNCGGETSSAEDVWLTSQPYLRKVIDPYCLSSRNATWEKSFSMNKWLDFLKKSGYNSKTFAPSAFSFLQKSRLTEYRIGSFTIPLRTIRTELNLRSSFFSTFADGDSIIFKGRGYGHGVGLCQEGAMEMADEGFNYRQIIGFYYFGVLITDLKNSVVLLQNRTPEPPNGGI